MRRIFLLAKPQLVPPKKMHQNYNTNVTLADLLEENAEHADLLVGDFEDTYLNLTYKTVLGLEWAQRYCGRAAYILKHDDDTIVDYYQLAQLFKHDKGKIGKEMKAASDFQTRVHSGGPRILFALQKDKGDNDKAMAGVGASWRVNEFRKWLITKSRSTDKRVVFGIKFSFGPVQDPKRKKKKRWVNFAHGLEEENFISRCYPMIIATYDTAC